MKLLVSILAFFLISSANSQFLECKLRTSLRAQAIVPVGLGAIHKDQITTSTLFANYSTGYGYALDIEYQIHPRIWSGLGYSSGYFGSYRSSHSLLYRPSSTIDEFYLLGRYFLQEPIRWLDIGLSGRLGLARHILSWDGLKVYDENFDMAPTGNWKGLNVCASMGPSFLFHMTSKSDMEIRSSYSVINSSSPVYIEKWFYYFSFEVVLVKRFMRDRMYFL